MAGLILLGKSSLSLYDDHTKRIIQLNFKPEIVKDIEIINPEQFGQYLKSFVSTNKITPSPLIMIVSHNMFFEKEFPALTKEQQTIETQKFLDNIPFEVVASTAFGTEKTFKIIATNGYFIEEVRNALRSLGFAINIALPSILFGNIGIDLNQATIKIIYSKYPSLKQYNLLKEESAVKTQSLEIEPTEEKQDRENIKKINKKNLITIGVFVLFIVVLFVIVFIVLSSQSTSGATIVNPSI